MYSRRRQPRQVMRRVDMRCSGDTNDLVTYTLNARYVNGFNDSAM